MIVEHLQAMTALLPAGPPYVYTEAVPDDTDVESAPYVRIFADGGYAHEGLPGKSRQFTLTVTAHCVGGSALAAQRISDWVAANWLDQIPNVPGRKCWTIAHDSSTPVQSDESTGRGIFDQIDTYVLRSIPAT